MLVFRPFMGSNQLMKTIQLILSVVLLFASFVSAGKLIVPKQYATIQSAIDTAVTGDQIIILKGIYDEKVVLSNQGINLVDVSDLLTVIAAWGDC